LALLVRISVLLSPRQCGKSRSLAVLAVWWAYRRPRQMILVVSAGDEAASRLLRTMQLICQHPLLAGSVVDETAHRLILTNGSEIRSVPASAGQVRGWSVDLLIVDEASFCPDDLLLSAALPTTAARPDARIVLASTPWADSGAFHTFAVDGLVPGNEHTRTFRWALQDATWITAEVVESARRTMPPLRFRCEYEGEFAGASDSYFSQADILAAVCDFGMVQSGFGAPAVLGVDWGRQVDAHALVLAGLLADFGVNGRPVVVVPWCDTSRRTYNDQHALIGVLARSWDLQVVSELNGVGAAPTERLLADLGSVRVTGQSSTQSSKENNYGRVLALLQERSIVLPNDPELLRQLGGISASPTPSGGLRIEARNARTHDDLPDALSLAAGGLPVRLADNPLADIPEGQDWLSTAGGIQVPVPVSTVPAAVSWLNAYGTTAACGRCGTIVLASGDKCYRCGAAAGGYVTMHAPPRPGVSVCELDHQYVTGKFPDGCPRCRSLDSAT